MNARPLIPLLTAALLAACGTATPGTATPGTPIPATPTSASTMKTAEASGRIAAWASGRIAAWARGLEASTLPDGRANTFPENVPAWEQVRLPAGHALAPALGEGVVVAVVDTGLDLTHPAFAEHLSAPDTWTDVVDGDADPTDDDVAGGTLHGHGTAVAGVILQLAPNATILPVRALDATGTGSSAGLAAGVAWAAAHGADVINVSAVSNVDTVLSRAIADAAAQGIYVTLAAGNDGENHLPFPARFSVQDTVMGQYAVNVGAMNADDTLADFSNYGPALELSAPGVEVASAMPGGTYALVSGTSFATPVVSGALALALGEPGSAAHAGQLAHALSATARNVDRANPDVVSGSSGMLGHGVLDVEAFLTAVR